MLSDSLRSQKVITGLISTTLPSALFRFFPSPGTFSCFPYLSDCFPLLISALVSYLSSINKCNRITSHLSLSPTDTLTYSGGRFADLIHVTPSTLSRSTPPLPLVLSLSLLFPLLMCLIMNYLGALLSLPRGVNISPHITSMYIVSDKTGCDRVIVFPL